MVSRLLTACAIVLLLAGLSPATAAPSARQLYESAMARERALRATLQADPSQQTLQTARGIVAAYQAIVRRYPASGYCDNALWQAGGLSADVFAVSRDDGDRRNAVRLFEFLAREYPTSSLAAKAAEHTRRLQSAAPVNAPTAANNAEGSPRGREAPPNAVPARRSGSNPASSPLSAAALPVPAEPVAPVPASTDGKKDADSPVATATIREIRRTVLPEVVRVSIEMDREVVFHEERVENPARLLFDLSATKAAPSLRDANWTYKDDVVHGIRVGRHPNQTTRVVLDLVGVSRYTVVTLYNPYRILIDCERASVAKTEIAPGVKSPAEIAPGVKSAPKTTPGAISEETARATDSVDAETANAEKAKKEPVARTGAAKEPAARDSAPKEPPAKTPAAAPAPPETVPGNRVSMARQLGLGVSRVVIDPGHGGRDPGAEGARLSEAQIVLDIALRLEKALKRQPGIDVVLTRRTDVFVPLEERTAMANREQADLFLSIHANASRNQNARGIESYYLNFASNPDAEAVAARENSASERTMNSLSDIVKAITLNNKLDESKDFAGLVQQAMARRLKTTNKSLKNLGVKQAPFVVLIGAAMPSVLAEVSFVTNRREGQLLGTESYRQRIADALAEAVVGYRRTLKPATVVAGQ